MSQWLPWKRKYSLSSSARSMKNRLRRGERLVLLCLASSLGTASQTFSFSAFFFFFFEFISDGCNICWQRFARGVSRERCRSYIEYCSLRFQGSLLDNYALFIQTSKSPWKECISDPLIYWWQQKCLEDYSLESADWSQDCFYSLVSDSTLIYLNHTCYSFPHITFHTFFLSLFVTYFKFHGMKTLWVRENFPELNQKNCHILHLKDSGCVMTALPISQAYTLR